MLVYAINMYILLTITQPVHTGQKGCSSRWFGVGCKCFCWCFGEAPCDINGICPNGRCALGFFGPGCQYMDLVNTSRSSARPIFAFDNDDKTCNPDVNATSIEFDVSHVYVMNWFRIIVKDNRYLRDFKTVINFGTLCRRQKYYVVDNKTIDVNCVTSAFLSKIRIDGDIAKHVCSVYISGGRNVALREQTDQSSDFETDTARKNLSRSSNAVDNIYTPDYNAGHCSSTASVSEDAEQEWIVTFTFPAAITRVTVYTRDIHQEYMVGYIMVILDATGEVVITNTFSLAQDFYTFPMFASVPVTSVKIVLPPDNDIFNRTLTICEIMVFGAHNASVKDYVVPRREIVLVWIQSNSICSNDTYGPRCNLKCNCSKTEVCSSTTGACASACSLGFYGPNCSSHCNEHCRDGICEYVSGKCIACATGFIGDVCNIVCQPRTYGPLCEFNCSKGCIDTCNMTNGHCNCKDGYEGPICKECPAGMYGKQCMSNCAFSCSSACNHTDGKCTCTVGYTGLQCTDAVCPHGFVCGGICKCALHVMCDAVSNHCTNTCKPGFYGNTCSENCSHNCDRNECDAHSGKCLHCLPGFEGEHCSKECKPGTYGPSCERNCSKHCTKTCNLVNGYCICKTGYLGYRCTECPPRKYGNACKMSCSEMCNGSCDIETGHCLTCVGSRIGPVCAECPDTFYGPLCQSPCPDNCVGKSCEIWNGTCFSCIAGYQGDRCQNICDPGLFGTECLYSCSQHCFDVCHHQTGACICKSLYEGPQCTECPKGKFGGDCARMCSSLCLSHLCHSDTGDCVSCIGNRIGKMCQDCPVKYYGPLCDGKCPEHCLNETCNQLTGHCIACKDGYTGRTCFHGPDTTDYGKILALMFILTLVIVASSFCCASRKRNSSGSRYQHRQNEDVLLELAEVRGEN